DDLRVDRNRACGVDSQLQRILAVTVRPTRAITVLLSYDNGTMNNLDAGACLSRGGAAKGVSGGVELHAAAGEHRLEFRTPDRLRVGLGGFHQALLHQLVQRVVETDHARALAGLHDRLDLEGLSFADQVADGRVDDQHFLGGDAPAPLFPAQN